MVKFIVPFWIAPGSFSPDYVSQLTDVISSYR